ncbi:hypothetical protein BDN67DRAFT_968938, partial [Paxillus ammoniavirescens]
MQGGGADIIELSVPFLDPIADGGGVSRYGSVWSILNNVRRRVALHNGIDYSLILSQVKEAQNQAQAGRSV